MCMRCGTLGADPSALNAKSVAERGIKRSRPSGSRTAQSDKVSDTAPDPAARAKSVIIGGFPCDLRQIVLILSAYATQMGRSLVRTLHRKQSVPDTNVGKHALHARKP
jgi:hypothetical protein